MLHRTPAIALAGTDVGHGDPLPALQGAWLITALNAREVRRVPVNEEQTLIQQSLFTELSLRLSDIQVAWDGTLYLLTDFSNGKMLHATPSR